MQMKWRILTLAVGALALSTGNARSEIVRIAIEGEINYVDSGSEWLNENFSIGDVITGMYIYDTSTPDSSGSSVSGHYWYYADPYGIYLSIGDFVFQSDPDNVEFFMAVANRYDVDNYVIRSFRNLPLPNGLIVDQIAWQLDDDFGTALSSDMIPATAPVLEDWSFDSGLKIDLGYKGGMLLGADVTFVTLVPEPTTLLLLGYGSIAFLRRRRP